ncbi:MULTISPECIES: cytochrome c biogenesis protein [Bacteroidota]|jgi:heme exporter protein C|uniref:Heme exporter protein C n=2 Tax=Flectobacillus TaxID=101 RepID=A0ABT6Z267_9BACT|nr:MULTISPECIES: cytochrome c biogenesis protein [Bacteroidota]MDI9866056.1 cytochrome c biogenesis protein [Flectobacillus longus]MDI9875209.1 cytochrome c biogenesis protein [Flectobacillus rivi]NBB27473.1 ABC transporter permease [Cellulophaga sp. BC115SP]
MKQNWYKYLAVLMLSYVMVWGFLGHIPRQPVLHETARNLYFHVPMWFSMFVMLTISVINSIKYLRNPLTAIDDKAESYAYTGILFGVVGCATGSIWARYTWGTWWTNDVKLNGAAIGLLIYFAYAILRGSFEDEQQKARISAIYNIFAIALLIPLLIILPRMTDSLHPGNGGNPGFKPMDTQGAMRIVFYPAVIGWISLGYWITNLRLRIRKIERQANEA